VFQVFQEGFHLLLVVDGVAHRKFRSGSSRANSFYFEIGAL